MDKYIEIYECVHDRDLALCLGNGVAYQHDMSALARVQYDDDYFDKVSSYDKEIESEVNYHRVRFVTRNAGHAGQLLDVGCGSCGFLEYAAVLYPGWQLHGFDVMPRSMERVIRKGMEPDSMWGHHVVTMWDVIEHLPEPAEYLKLAEHWLFVTIPVVDDLWTIRDSKHYRPNEHYYYWTTEGFVRWVREYGFKCIEISAHEVRAGRDHIAAFALWKLT